MSSAPRTSKDNHGRDARATVRMPTTAALLIIATVLPLVSFTVLVFVGKRMGKPLAGIVATTAIGLGFLCSILAMIGWASGGRYTPVGETAEIKYGMGEFPINL